MTHNPEYVGPIENPLIEFLIMLKVRYCDVRFEVGRSMIHYYRASNRQWGSI